jgi:eukaryotic-like serine/threonine-protein kinase
VEVRVKEQFGNYTLERLLGQGRFAQVYLGKHRYLNRQAAIKVLKVTLQDEEAREFRAEAQTLVDLEHPNIVHVLDFTVEQGVPALIMDYAPGGSMRQPHLYDSGFPMATVMDYVRQVAAALQHAHNKGIIHRDVKPENILRGPDQRLLLSDFGLAVFAPSPELLSKQELAGTLAYMAPEQIQGQPCFASDQYALGIVTYEWLCGKRPFTGTQWQLIFQHLYADPPSLREQNPSLPQAVEAVVMRALAKDPRNRFESVQSFADALTVASQGLLRERLAGSPPVPQRVALVAPMLDDAVVDRLYADLEARGIVAWRGRLESSADSHEWEERVRRVLSITSLVLIVLSPNTRSSHAVSEFMRLANLDKRQMVFVWVAGEKTADLLPTPQEWGETVSISLIDARGAQYNSALDEIVDYLQQEAANISAVVTQEGTIPTGQYIRTVEAASSTENLNRGRLLAKVRAFWITGVLDQSFYGTGLIVPGLREQSGAVVRPWQLVLKPPNGTEQLLMAGTSIVQIYDDAVGELLILGEPGSGKTTLLLELARTLLDRAGLDREYPIPVIFNLSSWATGRLPLTQWLVEEMNTKYQVPHKLGTRWVMDDKILPLLDGLDEVESSAQTACVEAINIFRLGHGTIPTVVCSRSDEFFAQGTPMLLSKAVVVQPLTAQQVNAYLTSAGEQLVPVRAALQADPMLLELATTPLMLNIMTLAYNGMSAEELHMKGSPTARRQRVLKQYVERMLQRRKIEPYSTPQQTEHWLMRLAQQLESHNQTQFYLERIQPDWLPGKWSRRLYYGIAVKPVDALVGIIVGMLVGGFGNYYIGALGFGIVGLLVSLLARNKEADSQTGKLWSWQRLVRFSSIRNGVIFGLVIGLSYEMVRRVSIEPSDVLFDALIGGLIGLLVGALVGIRGTRIHPVEIVVWSWRRFINVVHLRNGLLGGLGIGLINLLILSSIYVFMDALQSALVSGILGGILTTLLSALLGGLSSNILDDHYRIVPNQGIRRSARNSVLVGLSFGLTVGLIVGLSFGLVSGLFYGSAYGLIRGVLFGITYGLGVGLVSWLLAGGDACIKHYVVRLLLLTTGSAPLNYPRFLGYATERILLRKVGGGYIFIHRLLLDYFASLDATSFPKEVATQVL